MSMHILSGLSTSKHIDKAHREGRVANITALSAADLAWYAKRGVHPPVKTDRR